MSEVIFILLFFGIPGIFGYIMAGKRGKNRYLWGFLCAVFPFFLMVLKLQYKPHTDSAQQTPPEHDPGKE